MPAWGPSRQKVLAAAGPTGRPRGAYPHHTRPGPPRGAGEGGPPAAMLAFTFPGQGSQRPGMGRPWADHESWELVGEASDIADRDLGRLLLDADAEELRDTRNAQLTTFVSSLMVVDAVERLGIEAAYFAGHSL